MKSLSLLIAFVCLAGCCEQPVEYRYNAPCLDATGHFRFGNPFEPYTGPTPYRCGN